MNTLIAAFRNSGFKGFRASSVVLAIDCATDEQFRELAAQHSASPRLAMQGDHEWDSFDVEIDGVPLFVTGPHRQVQGEVAA